MTVDKYTLYDERGRLEDVAAYIPPTGAIGIYTRWAINDLTDQIDLLEAVQNYDPRTADQRDEDELTRDEAETRNAILSDIGDARLCRRFHTQL